MARPNTRRLAVYCDASVAAGYVGISALAVVDDVVVGQTSDAFRITKDSSTAAELEWLISAAQLAVKTAKRLKMRNSTVRLLCDNQSTLSHSLHDNAVEGCIAELRKLGMNVLICYINGDDMYHNLCHVTSNQARAQAQQYNGGNEGMLIKKVIDAEAVTQKAAQVSRRFKLLGTSAEVRKFRLSSQHQLLGVGGGA